MAENLANLLRRSDTTRFVGCRIGDVALRGCSRGCCPYPDSEISENTRPHLLGAWAPTHLEAPTRSSGAQPPGRTGLYYNICQSSHRPKFICPEPSCRRMIKPFYDPTLHEYHIDEYQGWSIRPLPERNPEFAEAMKTSRKGSYQKSVEISKRIQQFYVDGELDESKMSEEQREWLWKNDPNMWWTQLIDGYVYPGTKEKKHMKRCPSCGDAVVRVGSNFRIPAKGDEKAWKEIESLIQDGVDMEAKFSPCWTVEDHKKIVEKVLEVRESMQRDDNPMPKNQ